MATSQQQQQPQQQQEAPAMVEPRAAPAATAANPEASAGGAKSFLAVQREAVRANAQAMALVTTTVFGMLCWWAYWEAESTCSGGPVGFWWYLGAFVLECVSVMCLSCNMYSVLSMWSRQSPLARLAEVHEDSDGGGRAVGLGLALTCLTFFLVMWSAVGLLSHLDASSCESGYGSFWCIFTVMLVIICCRAGGNAAGTFTGRHAAQAARAPAVQDVTV